MNALHCLTAGDPYYLPDWEPKFCLTLPLEGSSRNYIAVFLVRSWVPLSSLVPLLSSTFSWFFSYYPGITFESWKMVDEKGPILLQVRSSKGFIVFVVCFAISTVCANAIRSPAC
jgi:hypothetical protein